MKRLITYLAVMLCFAALSGNNDRHTEASLHQTVSSTVSTTLISAPESELYTPRPTDICSCARSLTSSRRPANPTKDSITIIKNGKALNRNTLSVYKTYPELFPSGLSEPTHRLISLHKLII